MTTDVVGVRRSYAPTIVLTVAFAAAVMVRVVIAGPAGPASLRAGLVFASVLGIFAVVCRSGVEVSGRAVGTGLVGAAVLVVPVLLSRGVTDVRPAGGFAGWAAATAVVATAEEAFLRGALFDALARLPVSRIRSADLAVVGGAIAFAALHEPLYGWHAVPLDFAVGLLLGSLRLLAGTWTAPAVAHVSADLAGWWLL